MTKITSEATFEEHVEQVLLVKAKQLLVQIAKHGEGQTSEDADSAADLIGDVERGLGVNQGALVAAGDKPPY